MSINNKIYNSIKNKLDLQIIADTGELSDLKNLPNNNDILEYKILIVGDNLSGKTSFCNRFALDEFDLEIKPSKRTTCYLKTISLFNKEIKIYLLDIEKIPFSLSLMTPEEEIELYKDVNGIIIIYDITNNESFEIVEKLLNDTKKKCNWNKNIPITIVGNKNDLKFLKNIDFSEANEKATKLGCELKEINCNKDIENVHNVMKSLISKIYFNNLDNEEKEKIRNNAKESMLNNN